MFFCFFVWFDGVLGLFENIIERMAGEGALIMSLWLLDVRCDNYLRFDLKCKTKMFRLMDSPSNHSNMQENIHLAPEAPRQRNGCTYEQKAIKAKTTQNMQENGKKSLSTNLFLFNLSPQVSKDIIPLRKVAPQSIDLFGNSLDIFPKTFQVLSFLGSAHAFSQLPEFTLLVLQQLERFLLDQNPIGSTVISRLIPLTMGSFIGRLQLAFRLCQLPPQANLFPFLVLDGVAKVCALWCIRGFSSGAQTAKVRVSELCLSACWGFGVTICTPFLCRTNVVKLVVDLIVFERGSKGCGNSAGDAEAFMSVVQDVQECEGGVLVDFR